MRSLGLCTFLNNCLRYSVLVRFPDPSFGELCPRREPLDEVHEGAHLLVLMMQLLDNRLAYEVLCVAELPEVFLFLDLFKRLNPHFLNEMLCHHFCENGSQDLFLRLLFLLFHLQLLREFVKKLTHLDLRVSDLLHTSCYSKNGLPFDSGVELCFRDYVKACLAASKQHLNSQLCFLELTLLLGYMAFCLL